MERRDAERPAACAACARTTSDASSRSTPRITGRERARLLRAQAGRRTSSTRASQVSLAAELDGILVGFLLARVWTGEFGLTEPVAVLDTIGVHPEFQHHGVGDALLDQLATNLRGLDVATLRTEVAWDGFELLRFFHHDGFRPAPRLCLDLDLAQRRDS